MPGPGFCVRSSASPRWSSLGRWKRLKNRLIAAIVRGLFAVGTVLPGRAAVGVGAALGRLIGRLARRERRLCERHLARALGLPARSAALGRLALGVFDHLGRSAGEAAWAWRSADRVREIVRFAPGAIELMHRLTDGGRGVLFVTGHVGNWELMAWAIRLAGIPSAPVGRQAWDPDLDEFVVRVRTRWGAGSLRRESPTIAQDILAAINEGTSVGVLIDQSTDLPSVSVPFFGRGAPTVIGPARLALAHSIPVVVGWIRRRPDGAHVVEIELSDPPPAGVADRAREWTARWTAAIERAIRDEPEQWVWMHRRWTPRGS